MYNYEVFTPWGSSVDIMANSFLDALKEAIFLDGTINNFDIKEVKQTEPYNAVVNGVRKTKYYAINEKYIAW